MYSVRPAIPEDIDDVYALIASQNISDYGEAMLTIDDLKRAWQAFDLENNTCMAFADGKLAGYAELLDGDSLFIYLAERYNVDLAFQLLAILEGKAVRQRTGSIELSTRISEKNQLLLQLFASNGYKSDLSFIIMELELHEAPVAPIFPEGIQVRTFVPGQDEDATYQADEEAAQDKGYHQPLDFENWAKRVGLSQPRFDPSLWFLACHNKEVVGIALNVFDRNTNTGWVDHLGVRRAWRNQGIGKALLLHSFGELYKRGVQKVKLSVDSKSLTNAPKLYQEVGMQSIQQYHIYKKELK